MRVLHVLEPADGGVAKHVRDVVGGQLARGHAVQAVVPLRGPLADDLGALGAGVIALDLRPEIAAVRADLGVVARLSRILRRGRWDVVHTHGNKAGTLARPLACVHGLPVVHSPHGFAYVSQQHRERSGQGLRRSLTLGIERACAPFARVILCVSAAERDDAVRDRIAAPQRLAVVPNGIAAPPDAAADPSLVAGAAPLVGFLARLHPQKAPLLLLDGLADLRRRGVPFRAALIGDGPLAEAVRSRVDALELGASVTVAPFPGDVWPVLAAFDLYVLPSLWESMPIALLEAMAAGLPVVAADTGGVGEVVLDGVTGLLHPPGDAHALADALARMLCDETLRRQMGAAGRSRQRTEYSLEAMLDGLERAYARAITG